MEGKGAWRRGRGAPGEWNGRVEREEGKGRGDTVRGGREREKGKEIGEKEDHLVILRVKEHCVEKKRKHREKASIWYTG